MSTNEDNVITIEVFKMGEGEMGRGGGYRQAPTK